MFLISRNKKIGKIYQISDFSSFLENKPNILVICTFKRINHPYTQICCTEEEIINEIIKNPKDILIYSVSTINVTNRLYKYMQILNCKGSDVFVHTFSNTKLWYVDQQLYVM